MDAGTWLAGKSVAGEPARNEMPCPLPIDVAVEILSYLDSPGSLFAFILTSRVFWYAFDSRRQFILKCVLRRYITPRLLPLAVAVYEAGPHGDVHDWADLELALKRSLGDIEQGDALERISPLTLEAAAALTEVHVAVSHFSLDLARPALANFRSIYKNPEGGVVWRADRLEPTERELQRIQRALYRFQLHCHTAGRAAIEDVQTVPAGIRRGAFRTKGKEREAQALLIGQWPTIANEQLACVCGFLEKKMAYYFDTLAAHDIEWGARKVDWVSPHVAVPHRRFLLNGGLLPLHKMSRTTDEGEWKRIIEPIDVPSTLDPMRFRYLETLEGKLASLRRAYLGSCLIISRHGPAGRLPPPPGPPSPRGWEDVDGASDSSCGRRRCMSEVCHVDDVLGQRGAHLREAGCVFWDDVVREGVAPDEQLRGDPRHAWRYSRPTTAAETARRLGRMKSSWESRMRIWEMGGSGRWKEEDGDESQGVHCDGQRQRR